MYLLMRAADALVARGYSPDQSGGTSGGMVLWLASVAHGARPAQWQEGIAQALTHRIPYIRELAMNRPITEAERFADAIGENLKSSNPNVQMSACGAIRRANLTALRPQLAEVLRHATAQSFAGCAATLDFLGGRFERVTIQASRLAEPAIIASILPNLINLLEHDGYSSCCNIPTNETAALAARWKTFVESHKAEIEAGKRISLDAPDVTPELIAPGGRLSRTGKPDWPPAQ